MKAEVYFLLLSFHGKAPILYHLTEIRIPSLLDAAQEPEPEPTERTVRVLNWSEGLRVTEADITLSVDTD